MWGRRIAVEEDDAVARCHFRLRGPSTATMTGEGEGCRKAWPTPLAWQRQRRQPVNERFTLNADFHTGRAGLAPASTFAKRAQPSVAPSSAATLAGGASFLASVSDAGGERTPPATVLEEKKPARGPTTPPPQTIRPDREKNLAARRRRRAQIPRRRRHVYSQNASVGITTSCSGEREYSACTAASCTHPATSRDDGFCIAGPRFLVNTFSRSQQSGGWNEASA
ncbi:hypothetical protein MRX96_027104 [Rhipicephalus microplus]